VELSALAEAGTEGGIAAQIKKSEIESVTIQPIVTKTIVDRAIAGNH
jgi:hypothetical protein